MSSWMVFEGIIISDLLIYLQLGTADCGNQCQMGYVFINIRTLMLCIVAFEYFNQKSDKEDVWIFFGILSIHRV